MLLGFWGSAAAKFTAVNLLAFSHYHNPLIQLMNFIVALDIIHLQLLNIKHVC